MKNGRLLLLIVLLGAATAAGAFFASRKTPAPVVEQEKSEAPSDDDYESAVPPPVTVSASDTLSTPSDTSGLGGYDVLIADRGNNRIIEVTPDKKIVWEYDFDLPRPGLGADDAFFAEGGKTIVAGLEESQVIQLIDYATKKVTWQYGVIGKLGSTDGYLHTPDDPYMLPNGNITVADISNCRVIEISPDKKIVRQYGRTGRCGSADGLLNKPNGDTPLPNGHMLISNIVGHTLLEVDQDWKPVSTMVFPLAYPSDPQMTKDGNILIAGYTDPGKILEISRDGSIAWKQDDVSGPMRLRHPSLAIELPNGNIMANDDENHRVIVIDKKTHEIVWQYGISGKPGRAEGQLNLPDGVDIIMRAQPPAAAPAAPAPLAVGAVSRHAAEFMNQTVSIRGIVLKKEKADIIVSDEAGGKVGYYDLPIAGTGAMDAQPLKAYVFTGTLIRGGLKAGNGNPYHLELSEPPTPASP